MGNAIIFFNTNQKNLVKILLISYTKHLRLSKKKLLQLIVGVFLFIEVYFLKDYSL